MGIVLEYCPSLLWCVYMVLLLLYHCILKERAWAQSKFPKIIQILHRINMNAHLSLCAMILHAVRKKRTVCILSHKIARELIMKNKVSCPELGPSSFPLPFFLPLLHLSVFLVCCFHGVSPTVFASVLFHLGD